MPRPPMDPKLRDAITQDIVRTTGTPDGSIRKIAARNNVSDSTVRKVRDEAGLEAPEITRVHTKSATEQTRANNAQLRAQIAKRLLAVANEALDDMNAEATIYNFGGKDNTYNEKKVGRPPTGDRRNLATIAAIALDKHKMLDAYDADASQGADMDRFLRALGGQRPSGDLVLDNVIDGDEA